MKIFEIKTHILNNKTLYYLGNWNEKIFEKTVAIVGSRKMTRYGREVVDKIMPELVAQKVTIISGLMYGVDEYAHRQCLSLGGKTIGIAGWGLDYKIENSLNREIIDHNGLIISEYEPDFLPTVWSFPQRNKIVARLATMGVIVIEAGIKSGSLITAKIARQIGKTVWSVPGPINSPTSEGTNYLIKNNLAKMLTDTSDLFSKKILNEQLDIFENIDETEKKIIKSIKDGQQTVDEIVRDTGLNISEIAVKLSLMSMNNKIEEEAGKYYLIK